MHRSWRLSLYYLIHFLETVVRPKTRIASEAQSGGPQIIPRGLWRLGPGGLTLVVIAYFGSFLGARATWVGESSSEYWCFFFS